MPVGNAGNITAYWKGYKEYEKAGRISHLPQMMGFQAEGAAPIVKGKPIRKPQTLATAIKIGNPASWKSAEAAARQSEGLIGAVTDEEILKAYSMLASLEGVFVEPASAVSLAGLIKSLEKGKVEYGSRCVCILTGHGLKDPNMAIEASKHPQTVPARLGEVAKAVGF